jgi:hypothetical protein
LTRPRLLSRSCTLGWLNWVWGDLWLTDDALFRMSRGMAETLTAARARKTTGEADAAPVTADELERQVGQSKGNRRVVLADVRAARLRRGLLNSRLAAELKDGSRLKLLWLKDDPAFDVLEDVLRERLGPELQLR